MLLDAARCDLETEQICFESLPLQRELRAECVRLRLALSSHSLLCLVPSGDEKHCGARVLRCVSPELADQRDLRALDDSAVLFD